MAPRKIAPRTAIIVSLDLLLAGMGVGAGRRLSVIGYWGRWVATPPWGRTRWGRIRKGAARKRCRHSFLTLPPQSKRGEPGGLVLCLVKLPFLVVRRGGYGSAVGGAGPDDAG